MIVIGTSKDNITALKSRVFIEGFGLINQILGIEVPRDKKNKKVRITQKGYIERFLCHFNMQNVKLVSTSFFFYWVQIILRSIFGE